MNKFKLKNANYLEKLGYDYYEDDGFSEFLKGTPKPNAIDTEYVDFKRISFNRLEREVSISRFRKNALCTEFIKKDNDGNLQFLNEKELQSIFIIYKELGWGDSNE